MILKSVVKNSEYRDSVQLMRISNEIAHIKGVESAAAMMATDNNKKILDDAGLLTKEIKKAGANDLAFAVAASDEGAVKKAFQKLEELLGSRS